MPAAEALQTDFLGRLKKLNLPKSHSLLPLFEALVNSFQAVKAAQRGQDGEIKVRIIRDTTSPALAHAREAGMEPSHRIDGFTIWDNGIGFNEENYDSFKKLDSRLKESDGGKGIGRLSWVKAYGSVYVTSVSMAHDGESFLQRSFRFVPDEHDQIQDPTQTPTSGGSSWTEVKLVSLKKDYQALMPKKSKTVADRIIQHCLAYFLKPDCPKVLLLDDGEKPLHLNEICKSEVVTLEEQPQIKIKEHSFSLRFLRLFSGGRQSAIHLCADDRDVTEEALEKHLPDLKKIALVDSDLRSYAFVTYVHSAYLNQIANEERTAFNFLGDDEDEDAFGLSKREILSGIVNAIRSALQAELAQIETDKAERVRNFIRQDCPKTKGRRQTFLRR